MSIFWTFSTWFGDGSGQFWWTLTYKRQFLDVIQSGFAVKTLPVLIWSEWNVTLVELVFVLSARSRVVSNQMCLHETIDYSVSSRFMNIKMKNIIVNVDTNFRHVNHSAAFVSGRLLRFPYTKISSHTCYLLMSAYQWHCKHILIGDYFPNPNKSGSRYYSTYYDKASYIISQAWLWSDSLHVDKLEQSVFNPFLVLEFLL